MMVSVCLVLAFAMKIILVPLLGFALKIVMGAHASLRNLSQVSYAFMITTCLDYIGQGLLIAMENVYPMNIMIG